MNEYTRLFKFIELTRSQPQYGYTLDGIRTDDLSNLAEHHYMVTFIAWQMARYLQNHGVEINVGNVLEHTLVHDLGELFGGDIAMTYARVNPLAKEKAKAFEAENQKFMAGLFPEQEKDYVMSLFAQDHQSTTLEAVVAKLADHMECVHFKDYIQAFIPDDITLVLEGFHKRIDILADNKAKDLLKNFIAEWAESFPGKNTRDLLTEMAEVK